MVLDLNEPHPISFDLDIITDWQFLHKGKTYKLNVKEFLRLLELVKNENSK